MSAYRLSSNAVEDLRALLDYIAIDSPDAALRVLDDLQHAMRTLGAHPLIGHRRDDLADESLRFWGVHSYLIVYRPERSPIEIVRVLHGARDVGLLLE